MNYTRFDRTRDADYDYVILNFLEASFKRKVVKILAHTKTKNEKFTIHKNIQHSTSLSTFYLLQTNLFGFSIKF